MALHTVQKAIRERQSLIARSGSKTRQRPLRRTGRKQAGAIRSIGKRNRIVTKTRKRRTTRRTPFVKTFPAISTIPKVTAIPTTPIEPIVTPLLPTAEQIDINAPAPLSEEIHSNSVDTHRIESIFYKNEEQVFDPGLWSMVVKDLPPNYQIPDPAFTRSLSHAYNELAKSPKHDGR
ncbi:hypothetical protein [Brevibacillus borstelensis]|uniref:hypothetical protein n=1 Tax=Brevibacillus borstelensis TaxID=45462 RepID=UPI0030C50896